MGKCTSDLAAAIVASRAKLRAHFPRGYELVFDNDNALVFGFAPTDKVRDSFISIAATLDGPNCLLEGAGSQARGVRLASPADLDKPDVRRLIDQACAPVADALGQAAPLQTVVKTIAAKQRSRRPPG